MVIITPAQKLQDLAKISGFGDPVKTREMLERNAARRAALEEGPPPNTITKAALPELVRDLAQGLFNDGKMSLEALVETLVPRGAAAINSMPGEGRSALMCAALSGKVRLVCKLLSAGADAALRDPNGTTALMYGAIGGDTKVIEALLGVHSEPNFGDYLRGDTALHHAAVRGFTTVVEVLVKGKADANVANYDGRTALCLACFEGQLQVIEALIRQSASVSAADAQGITPLMACARGGHHKALEALVWAGASVNAKSKNGSTALMEASQGGHDECIKVLIKSEASLNVVNQDGYTALLFARVRGHAGARDLLSTHGAHHFFGLLNSIVMHNFLAVIVRKSKEITRFRYKLAVVVMCVSTIWRGEEPTGLASGPQRYVVPFWDYRHDLHEQQREFDLVTFGMYSGPRYALHLLNSYIPASGRPAVEITWLEWVLVPELYILRHRDLILGGLPPVVPITLIASGLLRVINLMCTYSTKEFWKLLVRCVGWEMISTVGSFFAWYLYELLCPSFLCESGALVSLWVYFLAPAIRVCFS
jgi:ankyrin repeat protein